ncbi:SYF2 splicing factor-domain-containing protein [Entophlyctis helioformis]|nr:SYF2 splicing factor-domain-containing protein [Entophlyctis helioformis]
MISSSIVRDTPASRMPPKRTRAAKPSRATKADAAAEIPHEAQQASDSEATSPARGRHDEDHNDDHDDHDDHNNDDHNNDDHDEQPAAKAAKTAGPAPASVRQAQSKQLNRKEVHAEFARSKDNPRELHKMERKRVEAEQLLTKMTAEKEGKDYDRIRNLEYTIEDVERWDAKQELAASRKDTGFTDYAQISAKNYGKMIADFKPNLAKYQDSLARQHGEDGEDGEDSGDDDGEAGVYRSAHSLAYANPDSKPSPEALDRLVRDLKKQNERRRTFSRRREFDENSDVTYINEKNMHFNKKLSRAYDRHTAEIKAAFERGTAL